VALVSFKPLSDKQIRYHIVNQLWKGKSGGYTVDDGTVAKWLVQKNVKFDTIEGLPCDLLKELIAKVGYVIPNNHHKN
jgi:predicted house-cleaning NTP pyrophosphatase (Maf/HAM1 superfamily)